MYFQYHQLYNTFYLFIFLFKSEKDNLFFLLKIFHIQITIFFKIFLLLISLFNIFFKHVDLKLLFCGAILVFKPIPTIK